MKKFNIGWDKLTSIMEPTIITNKYYGWRINYGCMMGHMISIKITEYYNEYNIYAW